MSSSAVQTGLRRLRECLAAQRGPEESDGQLLHAFLTRRDDSAFTVLVHRHGPMVLHVCRRVLGRQHDAEDAFQATFLVLARHASSLRNTGALASWLHGTAYRIALKAKQSAARRRKHEGQTASRPSDDPAGELLWREVRALLDEEIACLPEAYKGVFVLCCLENLSRAEAGQRLGLKERTVSNRLAKARQRLQWRLARRGVELTAVLAASALATQPTAALPIVPLLSISRAAVSPTVAALVESASPILTISKVKLAAVLLLVASVLAGAGLWTCRGLVAGAVATPAETPIAEADDKSATASPPRETAQTVEIQGRVLGPDGQPKAGAKLLLLGTEGKTMALGVSAADGQFRVAVPKAPKYRKLFRSLVAQADGTGMDFFALDELKPTQPVELRLVKDHAIRGRLVSTEGKPIAGVHVTAEDIEVYPNNSMDVFLDAYLKLLAGGKGYGTLKRIWSLTGGAGALFATTTDAEGRFTLHGLGAERTVRLRLRGAGIADTSLWIGNRAGFDPKPYNQAFIDHFVQANRRKDQRWMERCLLTKPDFSVIVEAEKILRGTVTDADTGKGQAGLEVHLTGYWDDMMPPIHLKAKTDAQGRYEIRGARKAKKYLIQLPPDTTAGYMPSQVWADDSTGYQPVRADLKTEKGVIITGKVIDRASGEAIPGWAAVGPLMGNRFADKFEKMDSAAGWPISGRIVHSQKMDADGAFRLLTVPGPVLLMGGPDHQVLKPLEALRYQTPIADPQYPKYFPAEADAASDGLAYLGLGGFKAGVEGNFCKVLDIKPGTTLVKQDIILERARSVTVSIQDADGRPLSGVWVTGISPRKWYRAMRIDKDSCPVYDLESGKTRLMVFGEPKRNLASARMVKGDEQAPIVVKLGPAGSIKGRLLDADGKALPGVAVDLRFRDPEAEEVHRALREAKQVVTDANGAFALDGVIPKMKFELLFHRGRRRFEQTPKPAEAAIEVKPGECREVGALKLRRVPEKTGE